MVRTITYKLREQLDFDRSPEVKIEVRVSRGVADCWLPARYETALLTASRALLPATTHPNLHNGNADRSKRDGPNFTLVHLEPRESAMWKAPRTLSTLNAVIGRLSHFDRDSRYPFR